MNLSPKYIDLFAGAGGLSEGFVREGFTPVAHVESDIAACNTLKTRISYNYLKTTNNYNIYLAYLKGKINRTKLYSHVPKELLDSVINLPIGDEYNETIQDTIQRYLKGDVVDLIIGGPPCQAYSVVGRARSKNGMKGDPRNYLYVQYVKYLERFQPKMFVFENVLGLKSAEEGLYLRNAKKLFLKKGYELQFYTVESNNFGVLQKRKRIIIIGWRNDLSPKIPDLEAVRSKYIFTVENIFNDLPIIQAGEGVDKYARYRTGTNKYLDQSFIRTGKNILTQHISRPHTDQDKKIYRIAVNKWLQQGKRLDYNDLPENLKTHKNRHSFFDRFKVVAQDLTYAQTVVAHIAKDGHYYIHPDIEQNRSISIREAARLQSFPDNYYFEGIKESKNRTSAFKQIGNAVPPLMSQHIANIIKPLINEHITI